MELLNQLSPEDLDGYARGKVTVVFGLRAMPDPEREKELGYPAHKEVEYVTIFTPGDKDNIPCRPVNDLDKRRFAPEYRAWKDRTAAPRQGTPLAVLTILNRAQIADLEYFGVKTIEELAEVSDSNAQRMVGIQELRTRAKNYIASAKEQAPLLRLQAEVEKREEANEELQRQLSALLEDQRDMKATIKLLQQQATVGVVGAPRQEDPPAPVPETPRRAVKP